MRMGKVDGMVRKDGLKLNFPIQYRNERNIKYLMFCIKNKDF